MLLLGVDIETGGSFDAPKDQNFITEIGAVLWDTERAGPVKFFSELFDFGKTISPEAEEYTGIDNGLISKWGMSPSNPYFAHTALYFADLYQQADYVVAHNGNEFDKPFIDQFLQSYAHEIPRTKHWLDTRTDVNYPNNCKQRSLTYLGGFHKIINFFPHRAVTDVLVMMDILQRYNLEETIRISHSPTIELVAMFTYPDKRQYRDPVAYTSALNEFNKIKDKVKAAGFHWLAEEKMWKLPVKEFFLEKVIQKIDFPYKVVKSGT